MSTWNPMSQSYDRPASLADFLLARIAEDEDVATLARDAGQVYPHYGDDVVDEFAEMAVQEGCREQVAVHLRRFGPARVLADLEAKRAIVEQYAEALRQKHWPRCSALEDVLPLLALPYADHEAFDPAWRAEVTA